MVDAVKVQDVVSKAIDAAMRKAGLSASSLLIRSIMAGAILACATSVSQIVVAQGAPAFVGALIFPVGFVVLSLLELELATGNFAILTFGVAARKINASAMARNLGLVFFGNFLGSAAYALLFYIAATSFGHELAPVGKVVMNIGEKKTLLYESLLMTGLLLAFIKGALCNWMVCLASLLNMASTSTIGKILSMWLPIFMFFALAYEHSIVNMYAVPAAMFWGSPISPTTALLWNLVPVTLGNLFAGVFMVALPMYKVFGTPTAESPAT